MAISLKRTGSLTTPFVKVLVTGESGAGKTRSLGHFGQDIFIFSHEGGLLSLRDEDIAYAEVSGVDDIYEAYRWATESKEGSAFSTIGIDSLSDIAEVVLSAEKKTGKGAKDPRAAYGEMQDKVGDIIRAFRDMPGKNVIFTSKVEKGQTETGELRWVASLPGKKLTADVPYFFDEVLAVRTHRASDGTVSRGFQCADDGVWHAKDRSGRLDPWEPYDLKAIVAKIAAAPLPKVTP